MRLYLVAFLLAYILFPVIVTGQFYDTGTDPASIRWSQIKSENFRIVFPSPFREEAARTALLLEDSYSRLGGVYKQAGRRSRTNVLIHNYSTESNGYVAWAPKRMELYPMPGQNSIPQPHDIQLANHETVHIKQLQALETGFTRVMSKLTGQQFTGMVAVLLPNWFYEGDAILYETLLAPGGRGENPSFNKDLKALYLSKPGGYSFDKMLLGSYRHYTPDHYRYGFRMMEYSRATYGDDLWKKSVRNTANLPFLINPVNLTLRSSASLTKRRLFNETFKTFTQLWSYEQKLYGPVEYNLLSPVTSRRYINYHSPVSAGADSVIAIRTSLTEPPAVVLLTSGGKKEKRLFSPGRIYPYILSYSSGKITWAESTSDPRWENRSYSVVMVYDISTGIAGKLTRRSRYFAPALSPNGDFIAVVGSNPGNTNSVVVLDAISGYTTRTVPTPENGFPQRPQWSADGSEITVIMLTNRGEGIYTYNIAADEWRSSLEPSYNDLQVAMIRTDTLFFISSAGGTDNLFYRTPDGETFRATKSRYGIADFNLAGSAAVFSDYDYRGYKIATTPIRGERYDYDTKTEIPSSLLDEIDLPAAPHTGIEIGGDGRRIIPVSYSAKPYRKWQNILNVHSWTPFYFDLDEIRTDPSAIKPGVTLFSQNLLSTIITSLGYEYADGEHKLHSGITWKGWYPVVDFRMTYGGEPIIERGDDITLEPSTRVPALIASTEVYLPLRFSSGSFFQYIRPAVSHQYINRYIYDEDLAQFNYGQSFITTRIYFSNTRRSAYRDIFPSLAQVFDYSFTSAPFDSDLYGSISSLRTAFYFPGIFRNNGLRIRLQSEQQRTAKYILFNRIDFPRGYGNSIISGRLKTLSTDYVFPLFYPDLAAGGLFYLKRVRGSLFLDLSEGMNNRYIFENRFVDRKERFLSFGGELLADFNILRFPFDITGGARAGYIPDRGSHFLEAVFSIDIYGFSLGKRNYTERIPSL